MQTNEQLINKWSNFADEMLNKYKTLNLFQTTEKARCSEKILMAISFLRDLGCTQKQIKPIIKKAKLTFQD